MEDKKVLNNEQLEKVNGGYGIPEYKDVEPYHREPHSSESEPWYECGECKETIPKSLWMKDECCPFCGYKYYIPLS